MLAIIQEKEEIDKVRPAVYHWENLCLFLRKNLLSIPWDKCVRWFLDLPNSVKDYQTSKTPSSCLGAGQFFVRREIWQICQYTRYDLKENVNQENLLSIWGRRISVRSEARENYFIFARQSNGEDGRFVPR